MNADVLDQIVSACAELHSLLSVCSPEELPTTEYALELENMLPRIGADKISTADLSSSDSTRPRSSRPNLHKERGDLYTFKHIGYPRKVMPARIDPEVSASKKDTKAGPVNFSLHLQDEVYLFVDDEHKCFYSSQLIGYFANYQTLGTQKLLPDRIYQNLSQNSSIKFTFNKPGKLEVTSPFQLVLSNFPFVWLYDDCDRIQRDFEAVRVSEKKVAILFIHNSKRLAALTFDLDAIPKPSLDDGLEWSGTKLILDYSPEALARIGATEHLYSIEDVDSFVVFEASVKLEPATRSRDIKVAAISTKGEVHELAILTGTSAKLFQLDYFLPQNSQPSGILVRQYGYFVLGCCRAESLLQIDYSGIALSNVQETQEQSYSWVLVVHMSDNLQPVCSIEITGQKAPIHAMRMFLLNGVRVLICLDYYHNIKYFAIKDSQITEVEGPVSDYQSILHQWNTVSELDYDMGWGYDLE